MTPFRITVGTTTLILHVHPPGITCDACESTSIRSELPETLQMGILSGAEQKEFLEKAEAERIREFYNFDKYCWGPGMCKAAQEQVKCQHGYFDSVIDTEKTIYTTCIRN